MRGKIVDTTMEALQGGMSWRALADEPWLFKESQPRTVLCAPAHWRGTPINLFGSAVGPEVVR